MKQFVKQIATAINYLHTECRVTHKGVCYSSVYLVPPKGINHINDLLFNSFFNNNNKFRITFKLGNFELSSRGDDISQADKGYLLKMARELVIN